MTRGLARILSLGSSSFHVLVPKGNILSEVDPSYSFLLSQRWRNWGINGGLRGMERRDQAEQQEGNVMDFLAEEEGGQDGMNYREK